jgi:Spy/CpxP family protein refolding chaperone
MRFILPLAVALAAAPAYSQTKPAAAAPADTMQLLRERLKADKKVLITSNMDLTEAEAKKFWPLYEEYQQELNKLNDQIAMTLVDYAKEYKAKTLTDAKASALLDRSVAIEEAELKAKRALIAKVRKALPGIKATRYVQLENKIRALVKYEIAAEVPLAP